MAFLNSLTSKIKNLTNKGFSTLTDILKEYPTPEVAVTKVAKKVATNAFDNIKNVIKENKSKILPMIKKSSLEAAKTVAKDITPFIPGNNLVLNLISSDKRVDKIVNSPLYSAENKQRRISDITSAKKELPDNYKEPGIGGQFLDSFKEATFQSLRAIGGAIEQTGIQTSKYPINTTEIIKIGQNIQDYAMKELAKRPELSAPEDMGKWTDPVFYSRLVGQAVPSLAISFGSAAAVSLATKNPLVGLGTGFTIAKELEGGSAYLDAIDAGASEKKASSIAEVVGNINGVLEIIPIADILKKTPAGKELRKNILKRITKQFVKQGLEEGSTEGIQQIVSNAVLKEVDEKRSVFDGVLESFAGGFLTGGPLGAGHEFVSSPEVGQMAGEIAKNQQGFTRIPGKIKEGENLNVSKKSEDELIKEAKNYKSAEEFINSQPIETEELIGAMSHRPGKNGNAFDIEEAAPDFYEHPEYYKHSDDGTYDESIKVLQSIKGKPEKEITIYRASPENELRNGDWVSLSKKYAGQEALSENVPVHSFKVKVKELQFAGDDINEFGYWGHSTKTKSQLIDIWNKANKKTSVPDISNIKNEYEKIKEQSKLKSIARREEKIRTRGVGETVKEGTRGMDKDGRSATSYPQVVDRLGTNRGVNISEASKKSTGKISVPEFSNIKKVIAEEGAKNLYKGDRPVLNLKNFNISKETKDYINKEIESIKPEIEKYKGKLTHEEVLKEAQKSEIIDKAMTTEQTKKLEAKLVKSKERLAAIDKDGGKGLTLEYLKNIKNVADEYTAIARLLESAKIKIEPENLSEKEISMTKQGIIKDLLKRGNEVDKILEEGKDVDWSDMNQVTKFYRKFVKPTLWEIIDEYRYSALLSSPRTHIINTFSNIIQTLGLYPSTKLFHSGFDAVGSLLTGKERQVYAKEVPAFYKGVVNNFGNSIKGALDAMKGITSIERPDVTTNIPTGVKALSFFQFIPRLLEASDIFFSGLVRGGETESLITRALKKGQKLDSSLLKNIEKKANEKASSEVFRQKLDPKNKNGQGYLLSGIDTVTAGVQMMRKVKPIGWFIPFVLTPTNILKKGIEYSPLGVATLPGATNKSEQLAKSFIGSLVFGAGAWMALIGRSTWSAPKDDKEKELFYASGKQPYSLKIGDSWVSYSKIGPLAYPLAIASAIQYYYNENPKDETKFKKTMNVLSSISGFFADQSFVQGISQLMGTLGGDEQALKDALTNIPSQFIPLSSLQKWVASLIDPIYRKPASGFNLESLVQNVQKGIPFASKELEPYTTPEGEPSVRQRKNLFLPFDVGTSNIEGENALKAYNDILRVRSTSNVKSQEVTKKVEEEYKKIKDLSDLEKAKSIIEIAKEDKKIAKKVYDKWQEDKKGLTYEEKAIASLGVENMDRAKYILDKMMKLETPEERSALIVDYAKKGIITKEVGKQITALLTQK